MTEVTPDAYLYTSDDGDVELILDCHGEQARRLLELGYTECPLYTRPASTEPADSLAEARDALREALDKSNTFSAGHYFGSEGVLLNFRNVEDRDAFVDAYVAYTHAALSRLNAQGEKS